MGAELLGVVSVADDGFDVALGGAVGLKVSDDDIEVVLKVVGHLLGGDVALGDGIALRGGEDGRSAEDQVGHALFVD